MSFPRYRCAECGTPRHEIGKYVDGKVVKAPIACPKHPQADVLQWAAGNQTILIYLHARILSGATLDQLEEEVEGFDGNRLASAGDLVAGLLLYRRWGGIPERMAPAQPPTPDGSAPARTTSPNSPLGLFGLRITVPKEDIG